MQHQILLAAITVLALTPAAAEESFRERDYLNAIRAGGHVVPRYDKGYLIYLNQPNHLDVHRPTGELAFNIEMECPGNGACSAGPVAADSKGNIAVGLAYFSAKGRTQGIRILSPQGVEIRFLDTDRYVPTDLAFDKHDVLWSVGWQRDHITGDSEEKAADYPIVRKFSADGRLVSQYLPRSTWPQPKSRPAQSGRGYWRMYASDESIGLIVHDHYADAEAEWVEWDLEGRLLSRTRLPRTDGRAFTSDGRFYGQFRQKDLPFAIRVLDTSTGEWKDARLNIPAHIDRQRLALLGADGPDLVFTCQYGNVRLLLVRPEKD